jgi:hypothetical protein
MNQVELDKYLDFIHTKHNLALSVLYDKIFESTIDKVLLQLTVWCSITPDLQLKIAERLRTIFIDLLEELRQIQCPCIHEDISIVCDATNNPPSVLNRNSLRVMVNLPYRNQPHRSLRYYREISPEGITDYAHSSWRPKEDIK